jgi:predicted DNA-binding protein
MVKTTVYLEDSTKERLARAAVRHRRSEAELIREAIDQMLDDEPPLHLPALGILDSGDPTFAARADEHLAKGFGADGVDW